MRIALIIILAGLMLLSGGIWGILFLSKSRGNNLPATRLVYSLRPSDSRRDISKLEAKWLQSLFDPKGMHGLAVHAINDREVEIVIPRPTDTKSQSPNVEFVKRTLKSSCGLDFCILVEEMDTPEAEAMRARLQGPGPGPVSHPGDNMRWCEVANPAEFKGKTYSWNSKEYLLVYMTADKSMLHDNPGKPWVVADAYPTRDNNGLRAIGFQLNESGSKLFSQLTEENIDRPLAIVIGGKVISAPTIRATIGGTGIITGGGVEGFSHQDVNLLISSMSASAMPARIAENPVSETQVQTSLPDRLGGLRYAMLVICVVCGIILVILSIQAAATRYGWTA